MSLDALPESVTPPQAAGQLEIVQHLLTEALRTLQATNQPGVAPTEPVVGPKPNAPTGGHLKPNRPTQSIANPALRARAEAARQKMLLEPCGPTPSLTPEELAAPVARGFFNPDAGVPDDPLPLPVRIAFEELVFALRSLNEADRAAALASISAEFPNRTAG